MQSEQGRGWLVAVAFHYSGAPLHWVVYERPEGPSLVCSRWPVPWDMEVRTFDLRQLEQIACDTCREGMYHKLRWQPGWSVRYRPVGGQSRVKVGASAAPHRCHALGCKREVPPRLLMCGRHWAMVPAKLKKEVWAEYRERQEIDKKPTFAYLAAATAAVLAVAEKEGKATEKRPVYIMPELFGDAS